MVRAPKSVEVGLDLRFVKITGTWEPNDAERLAAWELYVELITRVAVVPLPAGEGLLREALTSLYTLFAATRDILRRHGPGIAEPKPRWPVQLRLPVGGDVERGHPAGAGPLASAAG